MLRKISTIFIVVFLILLSSCTNTSKSSSIQKVGMLLDGSVDDHSWNQKGYHGLLNIKKQFNVEINYKEGIKTRSQIINAVDKFVKDGVNLIFGHNHIYGRVFVQIAKEYPDVNFVYFNGGYFDDRVTSMSFNSHAMGFFSGMLAGKMSKTNNVGVIAAYEWQPEIEGFYEGVKFQNSDNKVHINFVPNNNEELALDIYHRMTEKDVDVLYPVGDSFSENVIEEASKDNIYSIGYISDQSYIDQLTVLTSTIQHVDKIYTYTAQLLNDQQLEGGFVSFDFQDRFISLGEFSEEVPEDFQKLLLKYVEKYKETYLLPNEM